MLLVSNVIVFDGDVNVGKEKLVMCVVCYGLDGNVLVNIYFKIVG